MAVVRVVDDDRVALAAVHFGRRRAAAAHAVRGLLARERMRVDQSEREVVGLRRAEMEGDEVR